MGSSRVKKPKQQSGKVSTDVMNSVVTQLNLFTDDIATLRALYREQTELNEIMSKNVINCMTRLTEVEAKVNKPLIFMHPPNTALKDMIDALKYAKPERCKAHDIVGHKIDGMLCGFYIPPRSPNPHITQPIAISTPPSNPNDSYHTSTPPPEKVSHWRNAEERCTHTLKAVQEALKLMRGIEYVIGTTSFMVRVRCQGQFRAINVHFNGTKHCMMDFYRRNGQYEQKEFANTTQAAAGIVAVCMYYVTR